MQRSAIEFQRRDDRQFGIAELPGKTVFLEDGIVAPTLWPVKLGDDRRLIFDPDLIDAIFVTVQREKPAVAAHGQGFERLENVRGLQIGVCEDRVVRTTSHLRHVLEFEA